LIDYDELDRIVEVRKPKLIIAGFSAYPRNVNFSRFKEIADKEKAILMGDIAHIAGLVAADVQRNRFQSSSEATLANSNFNPFSHCDVVTTTCHKTLRGPRAALIFSRRSTVDPKRIDAAVFPGLQGGPHNNQIAATAVALKEAMTAEFIEYADSTRRYARWLSEELIARGRHVLTNGTDTHLLLIDLTKGLSSGPPVTGEKVQMLLEHCGIYVNKNVLPLPSKDSIQNDGSNSATAPKGIRLGTAALATRFPHLGRDDVREISDIIHQGIHLTEIIAADSPNHQRQQGINIFQETLGSEVWRKDIDMLRERVRTLTKRFPVPDYLA
jgi:glycine hydroxymethyltransferase